jgi:hypothetical protein
MYRTARFSSCCKRASSFRIPNRIDTSSIDTGSSATTISAPGANARAMATRWR